MSIVTRTGDDGTTGLMYNRRVSKSHPRLEACGAVDELNAALGFVRASAAPAPANERWLSLQKDLVTLMGELATLPEDLERYQRDGFQRISSAQTESLEKWIRELEAEGADIRGWAMPGSSVQAAALDLARTACRRAERRVCALKDTGDALRPELGIFLNRLSDLLWLAARAAEAGGAH